MTETDQNLRDVLRDLLKEHLSVSLRLDDGCYADGKRLRVEISFDGEVVSSDYVSLE